MHSYVFLRAFSGAVFSCFLSCFFWCLLVILLVVFFVLFLVLFSLCSGAFFRAFFRACPFSFLYTFPLGGGPVFCRAFFRGFWVFFPCFFSCFLWCFFCVFFSCIFPFFFSYFFSSFFFFVPWVAPETNNHNILHFGPCFFRCFFWWSLLVKIGYTQYIYIYIFIIYIQSFFTSTDTACLPSTISPSSFSLAPQVDPDPHSMQPVAFDYRLNSVRWIFGTRILIGFF